jgi:O-antigen/teichoic acid export membrane protein
VNSGWANLPGYKTLPFSGKFSTDIAWNIASFAVVGVVGVLLNFAVARYYDTAVLGVFNQIYALYILLSQVAVGGVHLSVLQKSAQFAGDLRQVSESFTAGLLLTCLTAAATLLAVYLILDPIGDLLDSPGVSAGLIYILPGLFLFSLNKVYLALLNGLRFMKAYAVFQATRAVFLLLSLVLLISLDVPGPAVAAIFSLAEGALFCLVSLYMLRLLKYQVTNRLPRLAREHLAFGLKAAGGNLLLDVNARVDVLLLGLFAPDATVGVYSFAATLADGFNQLPITVRTTINPALTQTLYQKGKAELERLVWKGKRWAGLALGALGILAVLLFPLVLWVSGNPELSQSWTVFAILMLGNILVAGYLPFQLIFNQAGQPAVQTFFIFLLFATNILFNLALIPPFGMYGSAIATAGATVLQIVFLRYLARKAIGIRI